MAISTALPLAPPRSALLAVLLSLAAWAQSEIAVVSAAPSVDAVAPPVPSLLIAVMAAAGIVRENCEAAPARTVANIDGAEDRCVRTGEEGDYQKKRRSSSF